MGSSKFDTSAESIGGLFGGNVVFEVPKFQRNYSWKQSVVERLWDDLMETFEETRNSPNPPMACQYLLGSMVLVNKRSEEKSSRAVIDGQQRLATLTLLFCAARDIVVEDSGDRQSAEFIDSVIENTHMEKHVGWKVVLNDTDREMFRDIQKSSLQKKPKTKSGRLLKNNYDFLHKRLSAELATCFGKNKREYDEATKAGGDSLRKLRLKNIKMLKHFIDCVKQYNFVVQIVVPDDGTAYQVFETLNDRGLTLTESSLIKNMILNKVDGDDQQEELNRRWNAVFDDKIGTGQSDDSFILESYRSRNSSKKVSKKNLYRVIKNEIPSDDFNTCDEYVTGLENDAEFITKINNYESRYDHDETKIEIYALQALGAKLVRIPILAAYRRWGTDANYKAIVVLLVKFFFKFRTVRQKHPGDVETVMLEITTMIENKNTLAEIRDKIKTHDDHEHFLAEFEKEFAKSPDKNIAKYVLQQITLHLQTPYDDVKPIDDLTLEHILPTQHKKWDGSKFFEGHEGSGNKDEFVGRLGNLTLLKLAINSKMKNGTFFEKKNAKDKFGALVGYNSSRLDINRKTVCNRDEWTADTIIEREKLFRDFAGKIWIL